MSVIRDSLNNIDVSVTGSLLTQESGTLEAALDELACLVVLVVLTFV